MLIREDNAASSLLPRISTFAVGRIRLIFPVRRLYPSDCQFIGLRRGYFSSPEERYTAHGRELLQSPSGL